MDGKCSKRDILPRWDIPGVVVPKPGEAPKPIIPVAPKPVDPIAPNAPDRPPAIAPEPVIVPKPADPKPPVPCKRADNGGCAPSAYTFSGTDWAEKGRLLRDKVQGVMGQNIAKDHDYSNAIERYFIRVDKKQSLQIDSSVEGFYKQQGIDMGHFINRDSSWTRYQVHGTRDPAKVRDQPPAVDVYISVKYKAMISQRLFRANDKLYNFPASERLPMSEFLFQLWKDAVHNGHADYGVQIGVGDLLKVVGKDVANADAKAIVAKAQQDVGGGAKTFTIKPENTAAFNAFSSSSSGVSKFNMLLDHNGNAELNNLKPVQIDVSTQEEMPIIVWTYMHT